MNNLKTQIFLVLILFFQSNLLKSQGHYWQQENDYSIAVDFDVESNQYRGMEEIKYTNNSPDTLTKLYFHLYFNAFQPESELDIHARNIPDPMYELDWKIRYLTSFERGSLVVTQILQDSKKIDIRHLGSILEAIPATPIAPGESTLLKISFQGQVPLICRRAGRDNEEGIDFSMAQWYPKLCVYDHNGWNSVPYLGREFYSDPGDYDVKIRIDSNYVIAAGADKISVESSDSLSKKLWHFQAKQVIDFAWAADPDYQHYSLRTSDGIDLHFYYQEEHNTGQKWEKMGKPLQEIFPYISQRFGQYPYKSYTIIQAGDSGMEYQQSCFITGDRSLGSLVGVSIHEIMHSWYQQVIATNEQKYAWMDEGFASFATTEIKEYMRENNILFQPEEGFPYAEQYDNYKLWASSGFEETMTTPANFFKTNMAYNVASYNKGEIFLKQMEYIIGKESFDKAMLKYFDTWKFKHPEPGDFIKIMEDESGIQLDWYQHFWLNTTKIIDYSLEIDSSQQEETAIRLINSGMMPMPLDVELVLKDGSRSTFIIPLDIMYGNKANPGDENTIAMKAWRSENDQYEIWLNIKIEEIESVHIDPSLRMADLNRNDNAWYAK